LHLISLNDSSYFALRILVKLPALAMDLVDAVLIYALVKRYASEAVALGAAALFALNPATIYVSAYWGQVDSVSWGFVLLALWLSVRSSDEPAKLTARLVWAWLAIAFSILIKPQARWLRSCCWRSRSRRSMRSYGRSGCARRRSGSVCR